MPEAPGALSLSLCHSPLTSPPSESAISRSLHRSTSGFRRRRLIASAFSVMRRESSGIVVGDDAVDADDADSSRLRRPTAAALGGLVGVVTNGIASASASASASAFFVCDGDNNCHCCNGEVQTCRRSSMWYRRASRRVVMFRVALSCVGRRGTDYTLLLSFHGTEGETTTTTLGVATKRKGSEKVEGWCRY